MDYDYAFIHEKTNKLLKQCEEVKKEIEDRRVLEVCEDLNFNDSDSRLNGGMLESTEISELPDTAIDTQNVEWRKLVDDVDAFLQLSLVSKSDYKEQFQSIVKSSKGGVTDKIVGDIEVFINKIDNDLENNSRGAKMESISGDTEERQKILFISHSSRDKHYMEVFVELLNFLGLREENVICTSVDGYGIPLGENIYKWLAEKFQTCDFHVIFALSHNYYESVPSLNEMGAAWAMRQKWDALLLPGFGFDDVKGCIDKSQMMLNLDADDIGGRLGELRDTLIDEFGLPKLSETAWERYRNRFLKDIQQIYEEEKDRHV